eukprot:Opistho-2@59389
MSFVRPLVRTVAPALRCQSRAWTAAPLRAFATVTHIRVSMMAPRASSSLLLSRQYTVGTGTHTERPASESSSDPYERARLVEQEKIPTYLAEPYDDFKEYFADTLPSPEELTERQAMADRILDISETGKAPPPELMKEIVDMLIRRGDSSGLRAVIEAILEYHVDVEPGLVELAQDAITRLSYESLKSETI